jgi:hypothetical protein
VLAGFAVAVSCRDATQVTVRITTRERCSDLSGVAVVVGPEQQETQQRFEKGFTTAVTRSCDASGLIGTLVVAPGGAAATIVVAAGVQVGGATAPDPATCADPMVAAKGCIIARRTFAFIDHTSVNLPIELDPLCIGKSCNPASTCFKGACVDATVTCNGSACGLPDEHPGEGGGNEAGSSDGAYDGDLDGMSFEDVSVLDSGDGSTITDASGLDTGTFDGSAPPCGNPGSSSYCYGGGTNGVSTPGSCSNPADVNRNCCRCTCAATSMIVSCDTFASQGVGASCHPTCP